MQSHVYGYSWTENGWYGYRVCLKKTKTNSSLKNVLYDGRGKAPNPQKLEKVPIEAHIMSFNPQVSHYKLENSPNRRYIDPHLTVRDMWKDYQAKHDTSISERSYKRVFRSMNIGILRPSQDECDYCVARKNHEQGEENHNANECTLCDEMKRNLGRAETARKVYEEAHKDISENCGGYTADMQKILLRPKMTIKEHFYVSRLVIFNETFSSLNKDGHYIMLWHEGIAGRKATDVASLYIKCFNASGKENITIWAVYCTAQNKNWWLYSALCWCVNQPWGPKTVTLKYLKRGHTTMRADSIHGSIGRRLRSIPKVRNFDEFVEINDKSARLIKPVIMHHSDFYNIPEMHRTTTSKKVKLPKIADIRQIKFQKGSKLITFRRELHGTDEYVAFLKTTTNISTKLPVATGPRGVTSSQKQKLVKLVPSFALQRLNSGTIWS